MTQLGWSRALQTGPYESSDLETIADDTLTLALHSWQRALPWFLMKPRSANSLWHISQQKHSGCQVDPIALNITQLFNFMSKMISYYLFHFKYLRCFHAMTQLKVIRPTFTMSTIGGCSGQPSQPPAAPVSHISSFSRHSPWWPFRRWTPRTWRSRERRGRGSNVRNISCPQTRRTLHLGIVWSIGHRQSSQSSTIAHCSSLFWPLVRIHLHSEHRLRCRGS